MKTTKIIRKIAWSIFLVGAAALIIANAYLDFTKFFPLLCGIVLLPVIIESLVQLNFFGVFFATALIGIIFSEQLGIQSITPWPILAAAVLLSIGFSIIFKSKRRGVHVHWEDNETVENIDDDEFSSTVKFGATTKFFLSDNFKRASLNCSFGSIKAYFDNAKLSPNGAQINISANFAGVELYIPKDWRVINNVSYTLGGLEEKSRNVSDSESPVLTLIGEARFSGITIYYI